MRKIRVVVWMNHPSHYQHDFFTALSKRPDVTVQVIYAGSVPMGRTRLGWSAQYGGAYEKVTLPERTWLAHVVALAWRERRSVHLINGIWSVAPFVMASLVLVLLGSTFFFHAEIPNPHEERGGALRFAKRLFARGMIACSSGVFAIGNRAVDYYSRLDVLKRGVHWFCYFSETRRVEQKRVATIDGGIIIYVGQLIQRKRVGDLIEATARLHRTGRVIRLVIAGTGPERSSLEQKATRMGIKDSVRFMGGLSPEQVSEEIAHATVLALPSQFDGWGIVINEALSLGIPVVVSTGCGAADLIVNCPTWGIIYSPGSTHALVEALDKIISAGSFYRFNPLAVEKVIGCEVMTERFLCSLTADPK